MDKKALVGNTAGLGGGLGLVIGMWIDYAFLGVGVGILLGIICGVALVYLKGSAR